MQQHTPGSSSGAGRKDLGEETVATTSEYSREGGGTGRVSEAGARTPTTSQHTGPHPGDTAAGSSRAGSTNAGNTGGSSSATGNMGGSTNAGRSSGSTGAGAKRGNESRSMSTTATGGPGTGGTSTREVKEHLKQDARSAVDEAKRAGREAWEEARHAARDAVDTTKTRTQELAEGQKTRAAEKIEGYGSAVHRAADKLREENDENIAHYADMVAGEFDRVAGYLRQRDVRSLLRDVEDGIRRRPEVALGALFIAGLALARFLKASSPPRAYYDDYEDYPSDADPGDFEVYGDEFATAGMQEDFDAVVAPSNVAAGKSTSSSSSTSSATPGTAF
ncbi:MAG: hypothetical protein WD873_06235 [Candidatus Hydrogenedentales bacterium]